MSFILAGALMGAGDGIQKMAAELAEKRKSEASKKDSLDMYRAKKDIDLEYSGKKKGIDSPSSRGISRSSGRGSGSSAAPLPVKNSAAPTSADGQSTADMWNARNPDNPAPKVNVPQPGPGGKSLPESMVERINEIYIKDAPAEDRIRLLRIAENMYADGKTKTEIEAWIANPKNWGLAEQVSGPGPVQEPGFFSRGAGPTEDPAQPAQPAIPSGFNGLVPSAEGPGQPAAPAPQGGRGGAPAQSPDVLLLIREANEAIAAGANPAAVQKRLDDLGINYRVNK